MTVVNLLVENKTLPLKVNPLNEFNLSRNSLLVACTNTALMDVSPNSCKESELSLKDK